MQSLEYRRIVSALGSLCSSKKKMLYISLYSTSKRTAEADTRLLLALSNLVRSSVKSKLTQVLLTT